MSAPVIQSEVICVINPKMKKATFIRIDTTMHIGQKLHRLGYKCRPSNSLK